MKKTISIFTLMALVYCLLSLSACGNNNYKAKFANLPELPAEIAAQLDTQKLATVVNRKFITPVLDSTVALAPCCGYSIEKELEVTYPYTRCVPYRDLVMAPIEDLVFSVDGNKKAPRPGVKVGGNAKAYKLTKLGAKSILDQIVCITSDGPWKAVLVEEVNCSPYTPFYTLRIAVGDEIITFNWTGGLQNHPANIGLVSCKQIAEFRFPCSHLSNCNCLSDICQAPENCNCDLSGQW